MCSTLDGYKIVSLRLSDARETNPSVGWYNMKFNTWNLAKILARKKAHLQHRSNYFHEVKRGGKWTWQLL